MKYAVIQTGGKQYKVAEGDVIEVESLGLTKDANVSFDTVLLYSADNDVVIGTPHVADVVVSAKVIDATKGKKIHVSKFKAKAKYRRTTGHRQSLTQIQIDSIGKKGARKTESEVEKTEIKKERATKKVTKKA